MPTRLTIAIIILGTSLLLSFQTSAQNFVLPDGEYMDTTLNLDTNCKDYNNYYYNSSGRKYLESSSTTLKEVQLFLKKNGADYSGSGYITFRFLIDCEGKMMQKVQVLQTDEKYSSYHFKKDLVNELYAFLKTLDKWNIAKTRAGVPFSYKAFLTFKIKNGKVINIIP